MFKNLDKLTQGGISFVGVVTLVYFGSQMYLNLLRTKEVKLNIERMEKELGKEED